MTNITKQIDNIKNGIPSITKNTSNISNISENLKLVNSKSDVIDNNKNNISENLKKIIELIEILKNKIPEKNF